jgi:hypothetical protein
VKSPFFGCRKRPRAARIRDAGLTSLSGAPLKVSPLRPPSAGFPFSGLGSGQPTVSFVTMPAERWPSTLQ